METLDAIAAQRAEPDAKLKDIYAERKIARTTVAELSAQLPALRKVYFSVESAGKDAALRAVEDAEDTIASAENDRDALERRILELEQERCAAQVKLCTEEIAAVMEILLPDLARLCALQQELGRQQSIGRTLPQRIGELELAQDRRHAEQMATQTRERQRALALAGRRHTQAAYGA
jgi:hypothetical protein